MGKNFELYQNRPSLPSQNTCYFNGFNRFLKYQVFFVFYWFQMILGAFEGTICDGFCDAIFWFLTYIKLTLLI